MQKLNGDTFIKRTPALSAAVIAGAQLCGILAPYTQTGEEVLSGFVYPDSPSMAMPVTFDPWRESSSALALLAALDGTVKFTGLKAMVSVTRNGAEVVADYVGEKDTPAAKAKSFRLALQAVMTKLVNDGLIEVVRL